MEDGQVRRETENPPKGWGRKSIFFLLFARHIPVLQAGRMRSMCIFISVLVISIKSEN